MICRRAEHASMRQPGSSEISRDYCRLPGEYENRSFYLLSGALRLPFFSRYRGFIAAYLGRAPPQLGITGLSVDSPTPLAPIHETGRTYRLKTFWVRSSPSPSKDSTASAARSTWNGRILRSVEE